MRRGRRRPPGRPGSEATAADVLLGSAGALPLDVASATAGDASHVGTGPSTGGFRLLVCGGPEFNDRARVWQAMDAAHARRTIGTLLQGSDAIAVQLAGLWAAQHRVVREAFSRYWPSIDAKTGLLLTREMSRVHAVLAFPGEDGSGWEQKALAAGLGVWRPFG